MLLLRHLIGTSRGGSYLREEVLVGARGVMQPLDQQGEELLETQAQALHLVRPPSGGGVLHPAQALDQSAVDVWNDGSEPSGGGGKPTKPSNFTV